MWFKRKKKEKPPAPRVERVAIPREDMPKFARMYDAMVRASRKDDRLRAARCALWTYIYDLEMARACPKGSKLLIEWPRHDKAEIAITYPPEAGHG